MINLYLTLFLLLFSFSTYTYTIPEQDWGIAVDVRTANIAFPAKEGRVQGVIPLMLYDGDTFFIRGLTGGIKLYNEGDWQFSLIGRYRYFDITKRSTKH